MNDMTNTDLPAKYLGPALSIAEMTFVSVFVETGNSEMAAMAAGVPREQALTTAIKMQADKVVGAAILATIRDKVRREVLRHTSALAFSRLSDVIEIATDANGSVIETRLKPDALQNPAVQSAKVRQTKYGPELTVVMHSKSAALDRMAKIVGLGESAEANLPDPIGVIEAKHLDRELKAIGLSRSLLLDLLGEGDRTQALELYEAAPDGGIEVAVPRRQPGNRF